MHTLSSLEDDPGFITLLLLRGSCGRPIIPFWHIAAACVAYCFSRKLKLAVVI